MTNLFWTCQDCATNDNLRDNLRFVPVVGMDVVFHSRKGDIPGKITHIYKKNIIEFQESRFPFWMQVFTKRKDGTFRLMGTKSEILSLA